MAKRNNSEVEIIIQLLAALQKAFEADNMAAFAEIAKALSNIAALRVIREKIETKGKELTPEDDQLIKLVQESIATEAGYPLGSYDQPKATPNKLPTYYAETAQLLKVPEFSIETLANPEELKEILRLRNIAPLSERARRLAYVIGLDILNELGISSSNYPKWQRPKAAEMKARTVPIEQALKNIASNNPTLSKIIEPALKNWRK